ncbi:MAG TPA: sensor domain-containing diguanylate cyclase [Bacteroidota bacterium]|nr:sensor domain-containing diguanylate cyclase [Bacteroidota bacterium]
MPRELQITDFFDIDSPLGKAESEPRAEFDFLLKKVLTLVKDVVFAHSVAFFWANRDKGHMVLESFVSDSSVFMRTKRFPMGHDLCSKISESGKPELLTEVNPLSEFEMLPYYDSPAHVKSFIGAPVFFSQGAVGAAAKPVAVLAADSIVAGAFGSETLILLGQFTKLLSGLINDYTQKYDLLIDSELLSAIERIDDRAKENFTLQNVTTALADESSKMVAMDYLSIVLFDDKRASWMVKKVLNRTHDEYVPVEQPIDFPHSIAAQTIKNNYHSMVDAQSTVSLPRYHTGENFGTNGAFLSLPISSANKCYGSLNVERREKVLFTPQDIRSLKILASQAAGLLEILYMNDLIDEYVIIDEKTGVCSKKYFTQRLDEELHRADDGGTDLSLLLVGVDHHNELHERFGRDGFDRVMGSLAKAIRSSVRSYDLVGRVDVNKFAVVLIRTTANEAYLWSEKIRKTVSGNVIELDGKNFSVTISAGVAGAQEGITRDELLNNAVAVLEKAVTAGGNAVRVY